MRPPLVVVFGMGGGRGLASIGEAAEEGKVPRDLSAELPRVTSQPRGGLGEKQMSTQPLSLTDIHDIM